MATQAFLSAVAAGQPAKHPITGEWVPPVDAQPVTVTPVAIASPVDDDPILADVRTEATQDEPTDPWGAGVEPDPEPAKPVVEPAKAKDKPARDYTEQYVALPRDLVTEFAECHGYTPAPKDADSNDPKVKALRAANRSGKGRTSDRFQVRDFYLAAALYRLAPIDIKGAKSDDPLLVIVEPSTLAAASGWPLRTLQQDFASDTPPLTGYVYKVEGNHYNPAGKPVWHFHLKPVSSNNFLKMPAWWLWKEPAPVEIDEAQGEDGTDNAETDKPAPAKWVKSCEWDKGSPALLVALAYVHLTDWKKGTNNKYGKAGLSTVCGVSEATIKRGKREARLNGWLLTDGSTGGKSNSKVTICFYPEPTTASDDTDQAADPSTEAANDSQQAA